MASAVAEKTNKAYLICPRCGGLMVSDFCMDLMNSTGEPEVPAKRCVQCGEVVDAVIQRNRQLMQQPTIHRQIMEHQNCHRKRGDAMKVRALMPGLTVIVAAALAGCATDGLGTRLSSGEAVKLVTAQEAVDRDFRYRQQATLLRDVARSLELEAQVAMQWPDSKQEETMFMRKAQAMRMAADAAEETARNYRRQAPHNQVN